MVLSLENRNATSTVQMYGDMELYPAMDQGDPYIWAFYDSISNLFLKDGKSGMPVN
jgi:hypothetical protein